MDKAYVQKRGRQLYRFTGFANCVARMDRMDKCQLALAKLFVPEFDTEGIPAFKDIREAYVTLTGDSDISGMFRPKNVHEDLRARQDFSSSSFPFALQNALNLSLSKMYADFPFREEILISEKKEVRDFRKIKSIQFGYFEDLPDVDPETEDYESLSSYEDSEVEYGLGQKGAVIFVTRMVIINNGVDVINAMTKRMARAARKAHARYVWNFYINNALCPDGTAWFTAPHGNLGSGALTVSNLAAGITALANMEEPGQSPIKLGLNLATLNWRLVVPTAMWTTAIQRNQEEHYYTLNDLTSKTTNPCYRLFGDYNERIVTPPFLTDADDWGIIRNKEDVPIVEMSYLHGHEEPELIVSDGPKAEHVMVADKIGYKIRHEYGGSLVDHRGGYKSIVP